MHGTTTQPHNCLPSLDGWIIISERFPTVACCASALGTRGRSRQTRQRPQVPPQRRTAFRTMVRDGRPRTGSTDLGRRPASPLCKARNARTCDEDPSVAEEYSPDKALAWSGIDPENQIISCSTVSRRVYSQRDNAVWHAKVPLALNRRSRHQIVDAPKAAIVKCCRPDLKLNRN